MGDRKLNHAELISAQGVDKDGKSYAGGRMAMFTDGPKYGIDPVFVSLHLEQVSYSGVFAAYPELKGKSEHPGVMCYSQPRTIGIMADWMAQLASLPNAKGVDQWMSENLKGMIGCQCDLCKATGVDPMVLEARAIVKAWRMAEERIGRKIDLRVLTSEATEEFNRLILAELPRGVKLVDHHSLLTYTCWHAPQLRQYLSDWANRGGWLSVCSNIGSMPGYWVPFDSPQFIRYRMQEYMDKGVSGLLGYSVPRIPFNRINTEAAAEYTWNVKGRSTREFAASWAVRQGLADPEKFAEYTEAVGQVLWDAYGSEWTSRAENWILDPIDKRLLEGNIPDLGYVHWGFMTWPFGSIKTLEQLDGDVALADRALKLAEEMKLPEFIEEARVARGLIRSLKALYELKHLVRDGTIRPDDKDSATHQFNVFLRSLREVCRALPRWEAHVRVPGDVLYTDKPVKIMRDELIDRMTKAARKLGIETR